MLSIYIYIYILHIRASLQASAASKQEDNGIVSVDVGKQIAIWTAEGQPEKTTKLQKGPKGFCTADFGWGPITTDTPNLLFDVKPEQVMKRPAAAQTDKAKKVPKFSHAPQDGAEVVEETTDEKDTETNGEEKPKKKKEDNRIYAHHMCMSLACRARLCARAWKKHITFVLQDIYKSENYKLEIYWKRTNVGFRQKHGEKKQLFSIGGTVDCTLSMDALLGWAEETLKRLDNTKNWKSVRDWVKKQITTK
jgi:hypothetical protein